MFVCDLFNVHVHVGFDAFAFARLYFQRINYLVELISFHVGVCSAAVFRQSVKWTGLFVDVDGICRRILFLYNIFLYWTLGRVVQFVIVQVD